MKKVFSIAIAFLVAFSIPGCAARNNGGTGVRRLSQQNNINNTNANYRDGVYTGYGDSHANTNEMAIVEIRNGRIVNVNLVNINQQGSGTNIQRGTNTGITNQSGTRDQIGPSNGITSGTGNTTGMGTNNQGTTNNLTGAGNGITYGSTAGTGNPAGTRNTTGTGTVTNNINGIGVGTTGGVVGTALDGARNNLVNSMIQNQRYDVNIANNNVGLAGTINNWKLAVSRALAQAAR